MQMFTKILKIKNISITIVEEKTGFWTNRCCCNTVCHNVTYDIMWPVNKENFLKIITSIVFYLCFFLLATNHLSITENKKKVFTKIYLQNFIKLYLKLNSVDRNIVRIRPEPYLSVACLDDFDATVGVRSGSQLTQAHTRVSRPASREPVGSKLGMAPHASLRAPTKTRDAETQPLRSAAQNYWEDDTSYRLVT